MIPFLGFLVGSLLRFLQDYCRDLFREFSGIWRNQGQIYKCGIPRSGSCKILAQPLGFIFHWMPQRDFVQSLEGLLVKFKRNIGKFLVTYQKNCRQKNLIPIFGKSSGRNGNAIALFLAKIQLETIIEILAKIHDEC